jgi:hypothetical protein
MTACIISFIGFLKSKPKIEFYFAVITVIAFAVAGFLDCLEKHWIYALLDFFVSFLWYTDLEKQRKKMEDIGDE